MKSVPVLGGSGSSRRQLIVGPSVEGCLVTFDSVFPPLCTAPGRRDHSFLRSASVTFTLK
jgi:hypothetical protein